MITTSGAPVRAVVIGGSTGIGRSVGEAWAASGIETHVFSRTRPVGPGSENLLWHELDLRDVDRARAVLQSDVPTEVSYVCYSAVFYTNKREKFIETRDRDWMDQFDINVHGLAWTLKATLPLLRRNAPGVFLHISSEVVYNVGPNRSGYAATKAAASSLIRSVSQETDPSEVRFVQALPAGMVDTPGIRSRRPPGFDYGTYMDPATFAPLATQIASTRGELLSGQEVVVHEDSTWSPIVDEIPRSQSHPPR